MKESNRTRQNITKNIRKRFCERSVKKYAESRKNVEPARRGRPPKKSVAEGASEIPV